MVEIIKRGKLPEDKPRRVTCGNCKSVLSVKRSEWESTGDVREPNIVCVMCPVCNQKLYRNGV